MSKIRKFNAEDVAEARGDGIVTGYHRAWRDVANLLVEAHTEKASEDEIDTLEYVENFLAQRMQDYGFND